MEVETTALLGPANCTCGKATADADTCTELDCPHRRGPFVPLSDGECDADGACSAI